MKYLRWVAIFILILMSFSLTNREVYCQRQASSIGSMKIEVIEYPEIMVFSMKKEMKDFSQEIPQLIQSSLDDLTKKGGTPAGPPILLYYMENIEPNQPIEKMMVEVAWPVNSQQFSNGVLLKIKAARVMYKGPYGKIMEAYNFMYSWITQNNYKVIYPTREIYHNDPASTPPEELLTEIIFPIEEEKD